MKLASTLVVLLAALVAACSDSPVTAPSDDPDPPPVAAPPGSWTNRAPLPIERSEMQAVALGNKIYVVGGLIGMDSAMARVDVYDPESDTWSTASPLPEGRHHYGMAVAGGKIYLTGGYGSGPYPWHPLNTVFVYDPAVDAWSAETPMLRARAAHAAAAVRGKIYAIGGETGGHFVDTQHGASGLNEVFDPAAGMWTRLSSMPTAREHLSAVAIGSTIFAIGGRSTENIDRYWETATNYAVLESYSVEDDTWLRLSSMPTARGGLGAAVLAGRLYAFGGEHPAVFESAEEYDPENDAWRRVAPLPTPRHGIAVAAVNDEVHVIGGGVVRGASASDAHEVYSLTSDP